MSLGDRPGITAKVTVVAVNDADIILHFVEPSDAEYFKRRKGVAFMAQFHPIDDSYIPGSQEKPATS
jgi:hypothetical protein